MMLEGWVTYIGGFIIVLAGAYMAAFKGQVDQGLIVAGFGFSVIGGGRKLEAIKKGLQK